MPTVTYTNSLPGTTVSAFPLATPTAAGVDFQANVTTDMFRFNYLGGAAFPLRIDSDGVRAMTVTTDASTTTRAPLRIPHGTAPTSPVDGDIWTTSAGLFVRINGATIGPLS